MSLAARLILAEWRHHPWLQAAAVLAVGLGVALAFAVQLINGSALAEFRHAVQTTSGAPDFSVRADAGPLSEDLYPRVAEAPGVAHASPVIELAAALRDAKGEAHPARILGLDALQSPWISPDWFPRPGPGAEGDTTRAALVAFDPDRVYLNAAARQLVGAAREVALQVEGRWQSVAIGGRIAAGGPPLVVLDIAGAQTHFGRVGQLSRIDVRLRPGARVEDVMAGLHAGAGVRAAAPDEAALRMARLSQSYRVNLEVLSLVALFTGGFLVFSVQSLAVAKRIPQLALLGVLGLDGRGRRRLVWADCTVVGALGGLMGLGLGTLLAEAALRATGGDLGSGTLSSSVPALRWNPATAAIYFALGLASAFAGGWWPARLAQRIAPAQSLKGLSGASTSGWPLGAGLGLMGLAALLACLPPWQAVPYGAYLSVALLLLGGISLVPQAVGLLLRAFRGARHPVVALAVARALDQRHTATAAVAGVVASLSLVVALTVMVTSFRQSLEAWLGDVLPADLYVRPDAEGGPSSALLSDAVVAAAPKIVGVQRVRAERLVPVALAPGEPEAMLIARDVPRGEQPDLPWIAAPRPHPAPLPADTLAVYPSEVLAALRHLRVGDVIGLPSLPVMGLIADGNGVVGATPDADGKAGSPIRGVVRGIWRDYARQQGALLVDRADWLRLTGDARVSDLVVWVDATSPTAATHQDNVARIAAAIEHSAGPDAPVEVATSGEIRALSLRIFDRSFAVTRWLQGVALAIGLAGIAASFSAQVLARRREFGTLQHLGFTRRQVLWLVALEGALWSAVGAVLGLALGLGVSVVLVDVVNPQSFHWTMTLSIPVPTLAGLALGVVVAGALTAWGSGHAAAGRDVLRAVHEDW